MFYVVQAALSPSPPPCSSSPWGAGTFSGSAWGLPRSGKVEHSLPDAAWRGLEMNLIAA